MINGLIDMHLIFACLPKKQIKYKKKKTEIRQSLIDERNKLLVTTDAWTNKPQRTNAGRK